MIDMLVPLGIFLGVFVIVFAGVAVKNAIENYRSHKPIEQPAPISEQLTDAESFVQAVKGAIPRNTGFIFELTPLTYDRRKEGHDTLILGDFYVEVKMIDPLTKKVLRQYAPSQRLMRSCLDNHPFSFDFRENLAIELASGVKEVLNERAAAKLKGRTEVIT